MDLRRLRAGEWIAAISGAALVVSLFLPWYGDGGLCLRGSINRCSSSGDLSAWEALAVNDVVLAFVGLLAIALVVVTATQQTAAVALALDALVALFGAIAVVLVLVRLAWLPGGADGRQAGVWVGLAAALGVFIGSWRSMVDERLPAARRPDVEAMPAPRQ